MSSLASLFRRRASRRRQPLTLRAAGNLIGGFATGGNDPTNGVFVRPPQGNLISGNQQSDSLISGGAGITYLP